MLKVEKFAAPVSLELQAVLDVSHVLEQLHTAGHPKHQNISDDKVYELAEGLDYLEQTALSLQHTLVNWQEQIEAVHLKFCYTEFLSTHQLVAASQLLQAVLAEGTCFPNIKSRDHITQLCLVPHQAETSCGSAKVCGCIAQIILNAPAFKTHD